MAYIFNPGAGNPFAAPGTVITGSPGWGKTVIPPPDQETLDYHAQMLPIWIKAINKEDTSDYTKVPTSYLREVYPYVYFWGPKADMLVNNLRLINEHRERELAQILNTPGYVSTLPTGSLGEDLLLTYNETKLGQLLLREDVKNLLPYIMALHDAQLFRIAYRNVSLADLGPENLVGADEMDTPLHAYYRSDMLQYIPQAWDNAEFGHVSGGRVELLLSVFVRICLSEPVMVSVHEVAGDWAKHVAFCERWGLTP